MKLMELPNIFIGTDIVEVDRINELLLRSGELFKNRVFTISEQNYCDGKISPGVHYAGRFAAKESVKEAIFSSKIINQIDFKSIEILNDSHGVPVVSMNEALKIKNPQLSISHEKKYAVAFALLTL